MLSQLNTSIAEEPKVGFRTKSKVYVKMPSAFHLDKAQYPTESGSGSVDIEIRAH